MALSIAVVSLGIHPRSGHDDHLGSFIKKCSRKFKNFGAHVRVFAPDVGDTEHILNGRLTSTLQTLSETTSKKLAIAHEYKPFHLIHCHDWYSSAVGLAAARELHLPMILSLHSTEHERTNGSPFGPLSVEICTRERKAVDEAALVIVPQESTRQQVINVYHAPAEKVVVIPDVLVEGSPGVDPNPSELKAGLGLDEDAPLVLFAGEISYATGADLLMDALPTVCRNHRTAQFLFAGEGPLRGELQARAWDIGIGHRCRFLGDVPREIFENLLAASDFVVIPARARQDQVLAQMAIACGRPVLATHQAGITCVVHGQNGLVTFDNPGSIVWGIQELLFNPPQGMLRVAAKKEASRVPSLESIAARHYMHYAMVCLSVRGVKSA